MIFATIRFIFRNLINQCRCTSYLRYPYQQTKRDWVKENSCMYHWMKTSYYKNKFKDSISE